MDKFIKRDGNGSVDMAASTAAFAAELAEYVKKNELPVEDVQRAVDTVFDKFPETRLPVPTVSSLAAQMLTTNPAQYHVISKRVQKYIQGQAESGRFDIGKGKNGGVARLHKFGEQTAPAGAAAIAPVAAN